MLTSSSSSSGFTRDGAEDDVVAFDDPDTGELTVWTEVVIEAGLEVQITGEALSAEGHLIQVEVGVLGEGVLGEGAKSFLHGFGFDESLHTEIDVDMGDFGDAVMAGVVDDLFDEGLCDGHLVHGFGGAEWLRGGAWSRCPLLGRWSLVCAAF